jgi:hypothetical protein
MRINSLNTTTVVALYASATVFSITEVRAQNLMNSPPVSIEIGWDGIPCNWNGDIVARVKNISGRGMLLPKGTGPGFGSALIVRAGSGSLYSSSLSYIHSTPYDWDHMNSAFIAKLNVGDEFEYKIRIKDYYDINAPNDPMQMSKLYEKLAKEGGSLSVLYGLSDGGPSGWRRGGFFFADPELYTIIASNNLTCPRVQ